jgi:undecaprenyl-diphosphatase
MSIFQALILGVFQGISEFLPISSSGHLLVFKDLMGLSEVPGLFDVILHVATLFSVLVVFRKRIVGIVISCLRFVRRRSGEADAENLAIVLPALAATVCTAVTGLMIDRIDFSGQVKLVSGFFLVTAVILISASFRKGGTGYRQLTMKQGILVGIAQGLGVFPGISRSGITISAGLVVGLKREEAGEFAFLLVIPAIAGALVLKLKDFSELAGTVAPLQLLAGSLAAFVAGVLALMLLMPIVRKGKLAWFAVYLVPAGLLGLFLL